MDGKTLIIFSTNTGKPYFFGGIVCIQLQSSYHEQFIIEQVSYVVLFSVLLDVLLILFHVQKSPSSIPTF